MISTWITVPPPSVALRTCSARRAKSADKIEGASSINLGSREKDTCGNSITRAGSADGRKPDHLASSPPCEQLEKSMEDGRPRPSGLNLRSYLAPEELPRPLDPSRLSHRYTSPPGLLDRHQGPRS